MKHPFALALITIGTLSSAVLGRAATLEAYFDFTRYGETAAGSTVTSNVHGAVVATVRTPIGASARPGLAVPPDLDAAGTGVVLPAGALKAFSGDFTLQVWYRTGPEVRPNTLLYGGTTSAIGDDSLAGDEALFVGYNNDRGRVRFVRPITSNGSRWGAHMGDTPAGTGVAPDTLHDYVIVYDSVARRITAYMDGSLAGTMEAGGFAGLPSLAGGLTVGGVQNSAFAADRSAAVSISSFLMYRGALDAGQAAKIHAFGPHAALDELRGAGVAVTEVAAAAPKAETAPATGLSEGGDDPRRDEPASRSERPSLRRRRR